MTHRWTNPSKGAPTAQKTRIYQRDGHQCATCGNTTGPFEIDHIDNTRNPNYHKDTNLQVLCTRCHLTKTQWESGAWRRKVKRSPRTPIGLAE